ALSIPSGSPQPTKNVKQRRHTRVIKPGKHVFNMIGSSLKNSEVHIPFFNQYSANSEILSM
ncbi:MAG: hypothetical protein MJE68_22950, partial [Proteobacteria bacterium]|nr:hypothetical protein [Pseudomonadota bacterium]